jgi:hypothetical protein
MATSPPDRSHDDRRKPEHVWGKNRAADVDKIKKDRSGPAFDYRRGMDRKEGRG